MIKSLMDTYSPVPEHHILARMNGNWTVEGEWYLDPNNPAPIAGKMVNKGILGGHFIESSSLYDGEEKSRVIYGYDPEDGRFMAFAISAIAARCDLEHGHYDESADALCFSCVEYIGAQRLAVRFDRTISFLPTQGFDLQITYPDFEASRRLGMQLRMRSA